MNTVNGDLSREELSKRLKMKFVATIGTQGTIRGCTANEAVQFFRRDWSEDIYDYVRLLKYGNLQELVEKELRDSVRITIDHHNIVHYCAVASPDLEHCFRFIDHPQQKRNPFTTSLHFPLEQQALLRGQSRFSRSLARRPPPPPSPTIRTSTNGGQSRVHTPIYVRREDVPPVGTAEKPTNQSHAINYLNAGIYFSFTPAPRHLSMSPLRSPAVTPKEVWQKSKEESEISPFFRQIFESMTNGKNRNRATPFLTEMEKSRGINAPTLDDVSRATYAADDELNRELVSYYDRPLQQLTSPKTKEKNRVEKIGRELRECFFWSGDF